METLSRTPMVPEERRRHAEWQLIERLRALHAVSRDETGNQIKQLDGPLGPGTAYLAGPDTGQ